MWLGILSSNGSNGAPFVSKCGSIVHTKVFCVHFVWLFLAGPPGSPWGPISGPPPGSYSRLSRSHVCACTSVEPLLTLLRSRDFYNRGREFFICSTRHPGKPTQHEYGTKKRFGGGTYFLGRAPHIQHHTNYDIRDRNITRYHGSRTYFLSATKEIPKWQHMHCRTTLELH